MHATETFALEPPTDADLSTALAAWNKGGVIYTLDPDTQWWRTLKADSVAEARVFASTWYPSPTAGRFSPVREHGDIVPSAYAGKTRATSLWEAILRNVRHEGIRRVPEHEVRNRYLVSVTAHRPLQLLDIRRPRDAQLVTPGKRPPDLTAAWPKGYPLTAAWAQALRDRIPALDGIVYESHQVGSICAVFYKRSAHIEPLFDVTHDPQLVTRPPIRRLLLEEGQKAGVAVDFGDDSVESGP